MPERLPTSWRGNGHWRNCNWHWRFVFKFTNCSILAFSRVCLYDFLVVNTRQSNTFYYLELFLLLRIERLGMEYIIHFFNIKCIRVEVKTNFVSGLSSSVHFEGSLSQGAQKPEKSSERQRQQDSNLVLRERYPIFASWTDRLEVPRLQNFSEEVEESSGEEELGDGWPTETKQAQVQPGQHRQGKISNFYR